MNKENKYKNKRGSEYRMKRASGILLPVSSLPSAYGIGCFSREAYDFVDWLAAAGQSYWQILPLGPTGFGDSPYQSFSNFAGNPYYIDLEALIEDGLLTEEECNRVDFGSDPHSVDYGKLYENRWNLLKIAYQRSSIAVDPDFREFCRKQDWWLEDYALFMTVKACFHGASWDCWAEDIRLRWGYSIDYYRNTYAEEMEFYRYIQYLFDVQWKKLKAYANDKEIQIIGDLPIYVAFDSADAWAHPNLFQFDEQHKPTAVAGCPPDAFSATGQLWGNPLYRWEYHRNTGYDWWIRRMRACYERYDIVRMDHFRGFDEYYSIPAEDENAVGGHWEKGPGMELFHTLEQALGERPVIAEDLGFMTPGVEKLVADSGYPNMKVLEFGFVPGVETGHLPHAYEKNCVVYTGTHDNETVEAWYEELGDRKKSYLLDYLDKEKPGKNGISRDLIRLAMMSSADTCIIPLQDWLGLGRGARMNYPSTIGTNWKWRTDAAVFTKKLQKEIRSLTEFAFRAEPQPEDESVSTEETEAADESVSAKETEVADESVSTKENETTTTKEMEAKISCNL